MSEADAYARIGDAQRAQQALDDFVSPAFAVIRTSYVNALANIAARPLTADNRVGMEKLALGIKVLDEVRGQIEAVAKDGIVARAEIRHAEQIARIPAEKRSWLGL